MSPDLAYTIVGACLLIAVMLPRAINNLPVSAPVVLLAIGMVIGAMPWLDLDEINPGKHRAAVEHLTELTVIVALMGVGLAIDRPLSLWRRRRTSWLSWETTWRLLGIAMPLCIAAVMLLGWWAGLPPAAALLLGAVLAPTDPVLAGDVQVGGPSVDMDPDDDVEEHEAEDDVRFALTSEAGLNDSLAFPFLYASILWAGSGSAGDWLPEWFGFYLLGKIAIGVVGGALIGWLLGQFAFGEHPRFVPLAKQGEPLLAVAALVFSYGICELLQGYGFLAVFVTALVVRARERRSEYHRDMHEVIERLERLLTLIVLLLLGAALTNGTLAALDWRGVAIGLALVFVIRPLAGWLALAGVRHGGGGPWRHPGERLIVAAFGVRGVGSLYYLAYGLGAATFAAHGWLWATVGFTIAVSVIVHGIAATPAMAWVERRAE